jgi:hypothetical protein
MSDQPIHNEHDHKFEVFYITEDDSDYVCACGEHRIRTRVEINGVFFYSVDGKTGSYWPFGSEEYKENRHE